MKKKFLLCLLMLIAGAFLQVYAQTVEVEALEAFSTENPPQAITVKLLDELDLTSQITIEPGAKLHGNLINVVSPKRLKKNAKFSFELKWYTDENGVEHKLNNNVIASYTTTLDKAQFAKKAALGVGNHFVKGLSMGVAAVEGAVKNDEGNRVKSGAKSLYNASPLSYASKGSDLYFEPSDIFYLKFPNSNAE